MPEWTGETRMQLYQLLSEGRLEDARQYVLAFPALKRNELKPVNKDALIELGRQIELDGGRQRFMARMLGDARQPVWLVARLCFQHFEAFAGEVLAQAFKDYLATVGRSTPATEREWGGRYWWPHVRIIDRLNDYAAFILEFPTRTGLSALAAIPPLPQEPWNITPEQKEKLANLMSPAHGGKWDGIVRRIAPAGPAGKQKKVHPAPPGGGRIKMSGDTQPKPVKPGIGQTRDADRYRLDATQMKRISELSAYINEKYKDWSYMKKVPAGDRQRINSELQILAQEMDVRILLQLGLLNPPVVNHYLTREFSMILMRKFSRSAILTAVDGILHWLRTECTSPEIVLAGANGFANSIQTAVMEVAENLDPLFAASRRTDSPDVSQYYTCNKYKDLALMRNQSIEEVRDFLASWEIASSYDGRPDYERHTWQMDAIRMFLDQPAYADLVSTRLVSCLESGSALEMDWAFRLAFEKPERLGPDAQILVRLAACGLWQTKSTEAVLAVRRLHALAEFGRCTPAAAAAAIEQAFTIEEPTLWRAAAAALKALRKKDPALALQDPARVRELLARDPEKYGKYLNPLLKNTPEASRHA